MSDNQPVTVIHDDRGKWSGVVRDDRRLPPEQDPDEFRAFARVVHRALRMICAYLERRYSL